MISATHAQYAEELRVALAGASPPRRAADPTMEYEELRVALAGASPPRRAADPTMYVAEVSAAPAPIEPRPFDRRAIATFAIPMAVLTILGWVGDAFAPTLLDKAPLLLLVCNPRLRNL